MSLVVDAHQHFWRYNPADYGWIGTSMDVLRRDFLPGELQAEMRAAGVNCSVAVQARQTIEETEWLLGLAADSPSIAAVAGWVRLCDPGVASDLERLTANKKLKAIRHVLQDEADRAFMLRADFNQGIAALRRSNLVYDILIFEDQLPWTIEFVDRHPDQVFVLDHIAKPRIRDAALSPWREWIEALAKRPNVSAKLSGMLTEADWHSWNASVLAPYLDVVLNAFTPSRLMFGSDWPVLLLAARYETWLNVVRSAIAALSHTERSAILGGTATAVYRIDSPT